MRSFPTIIFGRVKCLESVNESSHSRSVRIETSRRKTEMTGDGEVTGPRKAVVTEAVPATRVSPTKQPTLSSISPRSDTT
jgi:hypothetical protein